MRRVHLERPSEFQSSQFSLFQAVAVAATMAAAVAVVVVFCITIKCNSLKTLLIR
jgi:hypothetical protein